MRHIICLAIIFCLTEASVHKFLAKPYRLEGEAAAIRHNAIRNRRLERIPENLRNFESLSELSPKLALNRTMDTAWIYTANVTIGTPAQTYLMEIDLFYAADLCIIGSSANLSRVDADLPPKHTYDPSSSSTYVNKNGNFTDFPCGKGINGSDQIKIDDISANIVMGIITDKLGWYLRYYPVDGVLGLNPTTPKSNADNLASQLVATLDTPIMSWWQNMTRYNEGNAQLTLGGEDTDNCQSNYVYAPQQPSQWTSYGDYGVHIASAQIDGMPDYEASLNTTTALYPDQGSLYCTYDFFYVLTNASNAVYNETSGYWEVDCDLSKTKNIVLNIGGTGDKADSTTKQLILTGADYIYYWPSYDTCILYAYPSEYAQSVELSQRFMNNHCVAYNAKGKTVGFADVKDYFPTDYTFATITAIFGNFLSPEAYNKWVIHNSYSKQAPFDDQVAIDQSAQYDRNCYELSADAYYKGPDYREFDDKTIVFDAHIEFNNENWPIFQHFIRLLTDPFVSIGCLNLTPHNGILNLLAGGINSDHGRLQCNELIFHLKGNSQTSITWAKNHLRCNKFSIYDKTNLNQDDELLDFFLTGARCAPSIEVTYRDLSKAVVNFVQYFLDLDNWDEYQGVLSLESVQFSKDPDIKALQNDYAKYFVKAEIDEDDWFNTTYVFEFINNASGKKLQLTVTMVDYFDDLSTVSQGFSLKIEDL